MCGRETIRTRLPNGPVACFHVVLTWYAVSRARVYGFFEFHTLARPWRTVFRRRNRRSFDRSKVTRVLIPLLFLVLFSDRAKMKDVRR